MWARGDIRSWEWAPSPGRAAVEEFGLEGKPWRLIAGQAVVMSSFALPGVRKATGIDIIDVLVIWLCFAGYLLFAHRYLYEQALQSRPRFYVLVFGNFAVGAAFALSLPILRGTPNTELWVAYAVMGCAMGASEAKPSALLGLATTVAPFGTIPFFVAQGHDLLAILSASLFASIAAGYGYVFLAGRSGFWRQQRHEAALAEAARRLEESERERARLSRDLHDTIGTTLSLVALYGALAEHKSDDAETARKLAVSIRESARHALDDLRGLMAGLPQGPITLAELCEVLAGVSARAAGPMGARVSVIAQQGAARRIGGEVRTVIARVFQEAVHNALRHGGASNVDVTMQVAADRVSVSIVDDGSGFDLQAERLGTGLLGMRERAREVGGDVSLDSKPCGGTRLLLSLPVEQGGQWV
jgi:signal transduction histidine kinase